MRRIAALVVLTTVLIGTKAFAGDIINYTPVTATTGPDGSRVIEMPSRDKTYRRRMLFDFGLFGAGVHVGWLKPRSAQVAEDGTVSSRHWWAVGSPILNVSAGTHAIGLGTR